LKARRWPVAYPQVDHPEISRIRAGDDAEGPDTLVFSGKKGKPLDPDNMVKREFQPALTRAELRQIRFHDLRHTYASLLSNNGENIKYISEQMGHASVQVTLDRYGHLFPSVRREAVLRLEKTLFPPKLDVLLNATPDGKKAEPDGQDNVRPGRVEEDVAPWPATRPGDLPAPG
jgi:integrase